MSNGSGLFSDQRGKNPHLTKPGGGLSGEVYDLRKDVQETLLPLAALTVDEFTNPPAADTDAFVTSKATATSVATYSGATLDGVVGDDELAYPRNVTITTSDDAGTWAGNVTVVGKDVDGLDLTETLALANNTTVVGNKAFKKITSISVPAQNNTSGNYEVGFGAKIGLSKPIKSRAGRLAVIQEVAVGAVVTNGTLADAATGAPHGTYSPNTAANGANDYAVTYEYNPLA